MIACLVRVTKKRWPDCRSLSGAVQKYLPEAMRLHQLERRREASRETAEARCRKEQEAARTREQAERRLQEAWTALPAAERDAIRRGVLGPAGRRDGAGGVRSSALFGGTGATFAIE